MKQLPPPKARKPNLLVALVFFFFSAILYCVKIFQAMYSGLPSEGQYQRRTLTHIDPDWFFKNLFRMAMYYVYAVVL